MRRTATVLAALTIGATLIMTAPAAHAAGPASGLAAAAYQPEITFHCADGIRLDTYPPQIIGRDCTPLAPGSFRNVRIAFPDGVAWDCQDAQATRGGPGFVDVHGYVCELAHN